MLKLTRWTIAHRRIVVVSWIVLAVGVLAVSQAVGKRNANNFSLPNTDSQRAADLLQGRFPTQAGDADQIVFQARTGKLTDASTRAAIAPVLVRIARLPHVAGVLSPYEAGDVGETGDAHEHRRDRGAGRGVGELAGPRLEDDLVGVAGLGREAALK